ncbi:hypothetical protein C8Q77DRAFT_372085 [Trametes polyzona]|nr:hypothetical protein C8Q77DRAFT_372085 [Trametes polyzona]
MNRTGGYVDLAAGFITDLDKPDEAVHPVLVHRRLPDQSPAFVDYTPVLKLWASLDYEESQLLDSSVNNVKPLWEGTLTQLTGQLLNITVKRVNGQLVADGPTAVVVTRSPLPQQNNRLYTYTVELVFDNPSIVVEGVTAIVNGLVPLGYGAKFTQKGYDPEGALQLTLPPIVSCHKAELDVLAAIDANPTPYGKAFIRSHSGAALVSADNGFQRWVDISPGSLGWFNALPLHENKGDNAAFSGTQSEAFGKVEDSANGTAQEAPVDVPPRVQRRGGKAVASTGVYSEGSTAGQSDSSRFASVRRSGGRRAVLA